MNIFYSSIRRISFTRIWCSKGEGKTMRKMMKGTVGGRKKWYNEARVNVPTLTFAHQISKGVSEGSQSCNPRRVAVLNKLFMTNVTELMASGEYSSEFVGRGIEISKVKVTSDFQVVRVYWLARGTSSDESVAEILAKNAGNLRHELSQLRVMGVVPKIIFVRDRGFARIAELDEQLQKADFGDDYVPVDLYSRLKTELNYPTTLEPRQKEKSVEGEAELDFPEKPLPAMRMDVLGLNYAAIYEKIKKGVKKSQALHRAKDQPLARSDSEDCSFELMSRKQQQEAFTQFLAKRQIALKKLKRVEKRNMKDLEQSARQHHLHNSYEYEDIPDGDFVEESGENR